MTSPEPSAPSLDEARSLREGFQRLQMEHQFAIDEVLTKVSVLRREFLHLHRYNPIEHVNSRLKSPASTLQKAARLGLDPTPEAIRARINDLAGIRITCSFIADTYRVLDALTAQDDVKVLATKDYIANPKPNGYKSLHSLIEIPVFLSSGPVRVRVELQVRTIAMDFWASLEHKIFYKYDGAVPEHLVASLTEAARAAERLDREMEQLYAEVRASGPATGDQGELGGLDEALLARLWQSARASVDVRGDDSEVPA